MNLKVIDFTSVMFWQMARLLTIRAIVTKMISRIWAKGNLKTKLSIDLGLIPRGEIGLIFAEYLQQK